MTHLSARSLSKMAHIYKLRRDKLLELIEAENSWWLPPPSSLKPPTPSACVVKTVSGLFVRNDASRQRGVGTDVKSEYRREDEPLSSRPCIGSNFWKMDLGAFTGRGQGGPCLTDAAQ
jgi:hypothetical protein